MQRRLKSYFLNLLFLFYITLGPSRALCYYLFYPDHVDNFVQLQQVTKTRLSKKIIVIKDSQTMLPKVCMTFEALPSIASVLPDLSFLVPTVHLYIVSVFSDIPLRFLYCTLKL
ncbi:MAG TPA: hypothetical protein VNB90_02250 [Cytophagaceae bacterium]|nr:hypothetical protein [Cytophagaceae bacterium]